MYKLKDVTIDILLGDITELDTDAIVNAANNTLLGGGGVDGAIHRAGGPKILEQCKKIGGCPTGEARITVAGDLKSSYVIHTVGPIYDTGRDNNDFFIYNAYYNSLSLAREYGLKSLAFPSISTGVYRYPIREAVKVAYSALEDFLEQDSSLERIVFVLFSQEDYNVYREYFDQKLK